MITCARDVFEMPGHAWEALAVATVDLDDVARQRLSAAVRKRREELHRTQREVAERGDVSEATVNRIENGKASKISTATCAGLDTGLDWQRRSGDQPGSTEVVILGGSALPADHPRPAVSDHGIAAGPDLRRPTESDMIRRRWLAVLDAAEPADAERLLAMAEAFLATRNPRT